AREDDAAGRQDVRRAPHAGRAAACGWLDGADRGRRLVHRPAGGSPRARRWTVTDEELQASLLQPAPAEAPPDLDPDAALQAELLQPVDAPQGPQPARAADGRVYVVSPLGNLGTVDEAELPALGDGYQLATPAQGATLGAYGAVAGLVDDGYDRERRLREEYNPVTSTVGQVVGAVAPALLSGGAGAAGTAARLLPAGLEASLGAKMAASLGSKAAAWGAGKAGQLAVRAAATGLE